MNRKEFVSKSGAAALIASLGVGPLLSACSNDDDAPAPEEALTIDLGASPFDVLSTEDSWVLHPTEDLLLVNIGGAISMFSSRCPHNSCSRDWTFRGRQFICGCHGSTFENNGALVSGPATRGLTRRNFTQDGNILTLD